MRALRLAAGVLIPAAAMLAAPGAGADPSLECDASSGSQVEIGECVAATAAAVDHAVVTALGFAMSSAEELDAITERESAVPALEAGQSAWSAFRDAHCDYVGATYAGGSGTGIAIDGCRIELGRARVEALLSFAN